MKENSVPDIYITKCIHKHYFATSPHFSMMQAIFSLEGEEKEA